MPTREPTSGMRLRQALEEEICTGHLPPGTRLEEHNLAARFGVSRTPVREALRHLASCGLVEMRPRQGAIVTMLTPARMIEMFEVMAELESLCARLAAQRMSESERRHLEDIHHATGPVLEAENREQYYALNLALHECIYAGSHNTFLAETTRSVRNRLTPFRRVQLRRPGRMADSRREHAEIVAAIVAGDAEAAGGRMRQHVTIQASAFRDLISMMGGPAFGTTPASPQGA